VNTTAAGEDNIDLAIEQLREGRPVVVVDDAARENEGDFIFAAEFATRELVSMVIRHSSGFLCVSVTDLDATRLDLPPMHRVNQDRRGTAYTVSVDARDGISTGISARDRARTLQLLADPNTVPTQLTRPGHVLPLRADPGGVLRRAGHTEAAMDLMNLAGLRPAAGLCEIVSEWHPTQMAQLAELREFCLTRGLVLISIGSLINYRLHRERILASAVPARLPLDKGDFAAVGCRTAFDSREHLALVHGDIGCGEGLLLRIHQECLLADVFGSLACSCREELDSSLRAVASEGRGVVVYLRRHDADVSRGGNVAPIFNGPAGGHSDSTSIGDEDAQVVAQILTSLGVRSIRLLASDPGVRHLYERHGVEVIEQIPLRRAIRCQLPASSRRHAVGS
jgi:3,4-dihydroxy 2-butanone 4-phosphate synthase/GTP cyclohydrolase II